MSTDAEPKLEDVKVDEEKESKDAVKKVDNDVDKDKEKDAEKKDEKEEVAEETKEVEKPTAKKAPAKKKKETESEDEEDEEEDSDKGAPEQPVKTSGRQRKPVERSEPKEGAPVEIPEGSGVSLGSISVIEYNIHKVKSDELKKVHHLLFGRSAKANFIKKNIRKFNGFDFAADSEEFEEKKAELTKAGAKSVAELLSLPTGGSRDELVAVTMSFLLEPSAGACGAGAKGGGAKGAALTKAGRPRRTAAARAADKGYSESEDEDEAPRAPRSRRAKGKRVNLKDDSSSEDAGRGKDSSAEESPAPSSDESDDAPSRRKRGSTAKATPPPRKSAPAKKPAPAKKAPPPAAKKASPARKAAEKKKPAPPSDSDDDDAPLVKKAKAPPTEAEIKAFVKDILQGANLEEITMKTVCKQVYARFPEFDLAHKKDFIKATVKSLIST